jgi:hypothetical protein
LVLPLSDEVILSLPALDMLHDRSYISVGVDRVVAANTDGHIVKVIVKVINIDRNFFMGVFSCFAQ